MKKNTKLALRICLILFACVLMVTACNSNDTPTSNNPETTSNTTSPSSNENEQTTLPENPDIPTPSSGLFYRVNNDEISCTIIGIGTCADQNLVIPSNIDGYKVTVIGNEAFSNNRNITSVIIPNSVASIGIMRFKIAKTSRVLQCRIVLQTSVAMRSIVVITLRTS